MVAFIINQLESALRIYMFRPSWASLPSLTPSHPSRLSQSTRCELSISQSLNCVWLFVTPWTAACQAFLPIPNSRSSFKLMSTESVVPTKYLILCYLLILLPSIFCSIRVFSSETVLCIKWPKYWSFSLSISTSNEYSGLISFRITGLISLQSKELSRVFSNTTVQKHQFFGPQQLSHSYMTTGKNSSFD